MNKKNMKTTGLVVTGLFSAVVLVGGFMQLTGHEMAVATYSRLGLSNGMLMRFLGALQILGVVGMWNPKGRAWAVHCFTFLFCVGLVCHYGAGDAAKDFAYPAASLCLLWGSEWLARKTGTLSAMPTKLRRAA